MLKKSNSVETQEKKKALKQATELTNIKLNKFQFNILKKYNSSNDGIHQLSLKKACVFLNKINKYAVKKDIFPIAQHHHRNIMEFPAWDIIRDLMLECGALIKEKNHGRCDDDKNIDSRLDQYSMSDTFKNAKRYEFKFSELFKYLKHPKINEVHDITMAQIDFVKSIDNKFTRDYLDVNLNFGLRKATGTATVEKTKRRKFTINNKHLVEFDIKSSIFTIISNDIMHKLPENEQIKVNKFLQGDIYTEIVNFINRKDVTRDSIKLAFMPFAFSSNSGRNKKVAIRENVDRIKEYFESELPGYYKLLYNWKKDYKKSTSINKRYLYLETKFANNLTKRFSEANIISTTVYDAFFVPVESADEAQLIIQDYINNELKLNIQMTRENSIPIIAEEVIAEEVIAEEVIAEEVIAEEVIAEEVIITEHESRKLTAHEIIMQELQN